MAEKVMDKRLGEYVNAKENLTFVGKIFAKIVEHVYNYGNKKSEGFGCTAIGYDENVEYIDKEKHQALRWLVENDYLFCYENVTKETYTCKFGRYGSYGGGYYTEIVNRYGVTQKGWAIAHLYVEEFDIVAWRKKRDSK